MTALFGNICLGLATLTSGILLTTVFRYKAPHGGDGGVSAYPIWVLLNHTIFFFLIALAFIAIARKGGFDWFVGYKLLRYSLISGASSFHYDFHFDFVVLYIVDSLRRRS